MLPCRATARGDQDDPHHEDPVEGGEHDLCLFGTLGIQVPSQKVLGASKPREGTWIPVGRTTSSMGPFFGYRGQMHVKHWFARWSLGHPESPQTRLYLYTPGHPHVGSRWVQPGESQRLQSFEGTKWREHGTSSMLGVGSFLSSAEAPPGLRDDRDT